MASIELEVECRKRIELAYLKRNATFDIRLNLLILFAGNLLLFSWHQTYRTAIIGISNKNAIFIIKPITTEQKFIIQLYTVPYSLYDNTWACT